MTPNAWLINHFDGEYFSGNFDHLKKIIERLDLVPELSKVITVGGTNGKGQTVRILSAFFEVENLSSLLLTSPHIHKVNERFKVNNQDVDDDILLKTFKEVDANTANDSLSYFEFLYLVFLALAKKIKPAFIIQEVGLGGRLDATNAVDSDISVITSISRDHQELLGDTYHKILFEKLGISRAYKKLITSFELEYLRVLTNKWSSEKNIYWRDLFSQNLLSESEDFSQRNLKLAQEVYKEATGKIAPTIAHANDISLRRKKEIDGASWELYPTHNVDGLRKLIHFIGEDKYTKFDKVLFAPSKRNSHDLRSMMMILLNSFEREKINLIRFDHIKALELNDLVKLGYEFGIELVEDIKENSLPPDTENVLVVGSNYFIGTL